MVEATPESRLASLQRKFRILSEAQQATVTSIHATRYRTEVFDGRRVGSAFDTFLGYLRRGLTREELWLEVRVRHPTATQPELEIAAAASADVIRNEKQQSDDRAATLVVTRKQGRKSSSSGLMRGRSHWATEQQTDAMEHMLFSRKGRKLSRWGSHRFASNRLTLVVAL